MQIRRAYLRRWRRRRINLVSNAEKEKRHTFELWAAALNRTSFIIKPMNAANMKENVRINVDRVRRASERASDNRKIKIHIRSNTCIDWRCGKKGAKQVCVIKIIFSFSPFKWMREDRLFDAEPTRVAYLSKARHSRSTRGHAAAAFFSNNLHFSIYSYSFFVSRCQYASDAVWNENG